jgi:hypothetical protein
MTPPDLLLARKTPNLSIKLTESVEDNVAIIRLRSRHKDEGMPTWSKQTAKERDALLELLRKHFGHAQVAMQMADEDTTDRIITVKSTSPVDIDHVPSVMGVLTAFIEEHQHGNGPSEDGMEALMRAIKRKPGKDPEAGRH